MGSGTAGAIFTKPKAATAGSAPAACTEAKAPCPGMTAKGRRGRPGESADGRCGDRIDDRWAVPVAEAMRAMQILVAEGRALVGAEYWMRFGNRYQPTHEAWAFRPRRDGEAWSGYVAEFALCRGPWDRVQRARMGGPGLSADDHGGSGELHARQSCSCGPGLCATAGRGHHRGAPGRVGCRNRERGRGDHPQRDRRPRPSPPRRGRLTTPRGPPTVSPRAQRGREPRSARKA